MRRQKTDDEVGKEQKKFTGEGGAAGTTGKQRRLSLSQPSVHQQQHHPHHGVHPPSSIMLLWEKSKK